MSPINLQHFTRREFLCGKSYLANNSAPETLISSDFDPGGGVLERTLEAGALLTKVLSSYRSSFVDAISDLSKLVENLYALSLVSVGRFDKP